MINKTSTDCLMRISKLLPQVMVMACLLSMSLKLSAQEQDNTQSPTKKVTGTVLGADKAPLAGAAVKIKNRTVGTTTDEKGKFSINAAPTDTLVVSYINYTTSYIRVGTKLNIPVLLVEAPTSMNEVIVIAYGSMKRKEISSVIGKVNMEDVRKAPVTSFDQALSGRIAGVSASTNDGQPGGGSQIVIRGSTAGQDVSPLYVVDGFPIENMDLNSINTNDIETIEVLKDASAISIYGSRGANGVIIITTKKGRAEPIKVNYSESDGYQFITKYMKLLSPYEFVKLQLDIDSVNAQYAGAIPSGIGHRRYLNLAQGIDLNYYKTVQGYDWQKLLTQTGQLQQHNLSIIGGSPDLRYAINGAYTNQKGIIINSGLQKYDAKFSVDNRYNDKLRFGASLNFANTQSFGTIPTANATGGVVSNIWSFRPVDILGGASLLDGTIDSSQISTSTSVPDNLVSPLQQALNEYRRNITKTTHLNGYIEYKLTNELSFKVSGGISNTNVVGKVFYNSKTSQGTLALNGNNIPFNKNGINGGYSSSNSNIYEVDNILSYRKNWDKDHILDAIGGFTYEYGNNQGNGFSVNNIVPQNEVLGYNAVSSGIPTTTYFSETYNRLYSYLGRVNYSLKQRYIFTVTGREDGSSKFAKGHQWGFFHSEAFSWRFTQESFMDKSYLRKLKRYLSDGKLRVSYGTVGNNRVGDFSSAYQLASGQLSTGYPLGYPYNSYPSGYYYNNITNGYIPGTVPYFIGNPNLTWETTAQLNIGTSLSFFNDKILIDMDYYNKRTTNSLFSIGQPFSTGYNVGNVNQFQNAGVIQNRGFEFTLTTTNISKANFQWTTSFNIAFNKNKILNWYGTSNSKFSTWNLYANEPAWVAKEGYPVALFYGYKWAGVYQYSDFNELANGTYVLKPGISAYTSSNAAKPVQPGDPKYADINGDGVIDSRDRTIIGNPYPIHQGGLTNNFIYKNWSLNIFFQWSYGQQVLNANKTVFDNNGNYYGNSNQFAEFANHWTPNNPTNDIPRVNGLTNGNDLDGITRVSSRYLEDASYLRLKTINLSYNLPSKLVSKARLSSARVFFAAQNILTFTKYSGLDPEVSTARVVNSASTPFGSVTTSQGLAGSGYSFVQPSSGSAALVPGEDYTAYPRTRTFTLGAVIAF